MADSSQGTFDGVVLELPTVIAFPSGALYLGARSAELRLELNTHADCGDTCTTCDEQAALLQIPSQAVAVESFYDHLEAQDVTRYTW